MAGNTENSGGRRGSHWRIALWGAALLVPVLAIQFTDEVNSDETDFIVAGAMLFGACGAYELGRE